TGASLSPAVDPDRQRLRDYLHRLARRSIELSGDHRRLNGSGRDRIARYRAGTDRAAGRLAAATDRYGLARWRSDALYRRDLHGVREGTDARRRRVPRLSPKPARLRPTISTCPTGAG